MLSAFVFSQKRFLLVWGQQKWFHDFSLMWESSSMHRHHVNLYAFVLWGFQLNVLLACPWPGLLTHGGGWSLLLLAQWACTMSSPYCLTWDSSMLGLWTWVERGRKRKIEWGQKNNVVKTHRKESKCPSYAVATHRCMYPKYPLKMHRF